MAGPLHFFRKHQKILLALFGVLLMIAFVVVPSVMSFLRRQEVMIQQQADQVVVAWDGPDLRESDLAAIRRARALTLQYLEALVRQALQRDKRANPPGVRVQRNDDGDVVNFVIDDLGVPRSLAEPSLVEMVVLAEKARRTGVRIGDDAIMEFLRQRTDRVLTDEELGTVFRLATNKRMTEQQLFDHLRRELMAQRMRRLAFAGLLALSPSAAWEYHLRLFRRARIEAAPLRTADFLDQVQQTPSDAELHALYEQYKDVLPDPRQPTPGFKVPKRIAFQYVRADFEKFLEAEMAKVTDEQIAAYYEEHKEDFKAPVLPEETETLDQPEAEQQNAPAEQPQAAEPSGDQHQTGEQEPDESAQTAEPAEPAKPTEPAEPAEAAASSEPDQPAEPGTGQAPAGPDGEKPPAGADSGPATSSDDASQSNAATPARWYVSAPADAGAGPPAASADAGGEQAASGSPSGEGPTLTPAAPSRSESEASGRPTKAGREGPAAASAAAENEEETPSAEGEAQPGDEASAEGAEEAPAYKPLEDVADEIRRTLARPKAQAALDDALETITREVDNFYRRQYVRWQAWADMPPEAKQGRPPIEKPTPPDLGRLIAELTAKHQLPDGALKAGRTPLVSRWEIRGEDETGRPLYDGLGDAYRFSFAGGQFRQLRFADVAFQDPSPVYRPARIESQLDVYFAYWKVEQREEHTPELSACRDRVAAAWRKQRAFELARRRAEELAETARAKLAAGAASLKEALAGDEAPPVYETSEFTWMSSGAVPALAGPPRLGDVAFPPEAVASLGEELEWIGEEFMQAVFSLAEGDVGVTHNRPQTFAYVVRAAAFSPPEEELREQFLQSGPTFAVSFLASADREAIYRQWYAQVEQELGVEWKRPASANEPSLQ